MSKISNEYCEATTSYCEASTSLSSLSEALTASLRRPGRRTLALIEKALSYLAPFESPRAAAASPAERRDLLALLDTHRTALTPYIDTDRVESHLRQAYGRR